MAAPKSHLRLQKRFSWRLSRLFKDAPRDPLLTELSKLLGQLTTSGSRSRVLVVSGPKGLAAAGGQDFLAKLGNLCDVETWIYSGDYVSDIKALTLVSAIDGFKPHVLIGLGGGVAMDYAKIGSACAGDWRALESQETSQWANPRDFQIPIILTPTLFGSGAESTTHAVIYRDGLKYSMSFGAPEKMMKVLIPELSESAEPKARLYAALDAVSQGVETSWAKSATVSSQAMALQGLRDVVIGFDDYVEGRATGNRDLYVSGASRIGESMNHGKTTAPHALSYFLTTRLKMAHGHAVSILLRPFWLHLASHEKTCSSPAELGDAIAKVRMAVGSDLGLWLSDAFEKYGLESDLKILLEENNVDPLEFLNAVNLQRIRNHPVELTPNDLVRILKLEN